MTFDYSKSRATAQKLMTKFGAKANVITKGNDGGYDEYGDPIPEVPDSTIAGIVTPVLSFSKIEVDGETIRVGDGYVYFHSDTAPAIGGFIDINDKTWRIVDIDSLTSVGNINVYRKLQLRSGE